MRQGTNDEAMKGSDMKKSRTGETIFVLILIAGLAIFTFGSLSYVTELRTMPLIFGVAGILLLLLLLAGNHIPALRGISRAGSPSVSAPPGGGEKATPNSAEPEWRDVLKVMAYMVGFWVAILFFGLTVTVPLLIAGFLIFEARVRAGYAILSGLIAVVVMVLSLNVMGIDVWPGIMPEIIPDYLGGGLMPLL
ncbi:MAG TPA: hypothetical protein VK862_18250 [Afifellaceae bacterium]|nr:hypothetical protein [Afifellaceae bacterium]